ncbi:MAG TPA: hypothetical protein VFL96_02415 [Acidobacteriaceae bacterium]|jgi:hypothetical protein|nr:hypothetical protein [Acidobacteriaceae bacterium]
MTESEKNREREKIEMMVLEGLHSGEGIEITPQMWDELRHYLRDRRKRDS